MRPFTRLVLIILFALIVVAGIAQFTMRRPDRPYPGPVLGTPFPSIAPTP